MPAPLPEETSFGLITGITQDKQGFIWISSNSGVFRFDGYRWTSYLDPASPVNNRSECIFADEDGPIWVGTFSRGLFQVDPATGVFTHVRLGTKADSLTAGNSFVTVLTQDRNGKLWVGTNNGLYHLNPKTGHYIHYQHDPADPQSLSHNHVRVVYEDRNGTIWVGTGSPWESLPGEGGLNRLNPKSGIFTRYLHNLHDPSSLAHNQVRAILEDSRGTFWIGTFGDGLHTMDREKGTFRRYPADTLHPEKLSRPFPSIQVPMPSTVGLTTQDGVTFIHEDAAGNIWIGTNGSGLVHYAPATHTVTRYNPMPGRPGTLQEAGPWWAHTSREGMLWISTYFEGLYRVDPLKKPIPYHHMGFPVAGIAQDTSGRYWLGTPKGLMLWDTKTGIRRHFVHNPNDSTSLRNDTIRSLLKDRQGTLWVGTPKGLHRFDRTTQGFTRFLHDPNNPHSLRGNFITNLRLDRKGMLWVGSVQGLDRLDPRTGGVTHYPFTGGPNKATRITALLEAKTGDLWVGVYTNGIYRLDPESGKYAHFLGDAIVFTLCQDHRGIIWAGTNNGLFYLEADSGDFKAFVNPNTGKGMPPMKTIIEDDYHSLWLSTTIGLINLNENRTQMQIYGKDYGVDGGQLSNFAIHKSPTGELFFGSRTGYFTVSPGEHLKRDTLGPQIAITDFKIGEELVKPGAESPLQEPLSVAKQITLLYHQNSFTFEFAAMHYANPGQNRHLFRLEGYDDVWRRAGSEKTAYYYNVPPGSYTFRVKAASSQQVWAEKAITVVVLPPWWLTDWAYVAYGILLLVLLLLARNQIIRQERLKAGFRIKQVEADKLRELDSLKSRLFSNISHEFRTPLSLIRGTIEKLYKNEASSEHNSDYQLIDRNASRLLQLVNQLLDLSKIEAGKMQVDRQPLDITGLLKQMASSFVSLAESKGITYRYYLPGEVTYAAADADKLQKVITNLLSNAFKFTLSGGSVILRTTLEITAAHAATLRITVEDTGIGISKSKLPHIFDRFYQADNSTTRPYEGTGLGLALTKELLDLLGGSIAVESTEGKGTVFSVELPLALLPASAVEEPQVQTTAQENPADSAAIPLTASINGKAEGSKPQPETILIVEDNADLRQFLKESLTCQYTVLEAGNGEQGVEQALEKVPDLVISDLMMPGMDGISLCATLKTDMRTSHIPLILLTAKADMESKRQGLKTGADDYLTKPFSIEELHLRVKNLIEGRRKLRELFSRQVSLEPSELAVTSTDTRFLQKVMAVIEANMANTAFDVEMLSREVGMSRSNLHRKLMALTGQAANECIRTIRLKRAIGLFDKGIGSVGEVAAQVGFNSLNYFAKCFREAYGMTPSEYIHKKTTAGQPQE
ncbi:two-component regulator propeller domain-containing protein [Rhodocytophaga aerolata]|uniref:histidine kinase n=2 Tax=Rhodocytophaga aerolata TaxID=455078 RepID=A0ABT8RFE2_9BACT|nr:two-component regulator propeller domain-containing protein [Rhodocytophaga aerolata]MDO1450826.1 two-component regulator propeller domain-containing protein [Rhodocytophaga aerolata]